MQDVASAGMEVLGNTVPDSGTAGRLALMQGAVGLGGGGGMLAYDPGLLPFMAAGTAGLGGLYTESAQQALFKLSQALGRPLSEIEANALMGAAGGVASGQALP